MVNRLIAYVYGERLDVIAHRLRVVEQTQQMVTDFAGLIFAAGAWQKFHF